MDVAAEIEALVELGPRAPGSDAERRAANHLAARLEELGRAARTEAVFTWPHWYAALSAILAIGVAAGVASPASPEAGVALSLVAFLLYLVDAGTALPLVRRAFGRRASQNVVSPPRDGRPGALLLVAHTDAGRTGFVHRPDVARLHARLARPRRLLGGPLQPPAWLLAAMLAACLARLAGVDSTALTAAQFVVTVALLAALPLLVDVWLSPTVSGASDNASGVALALRLAERLDGALEHFGVHVLLTGAQESGADGMRAFLRRHRRELPRDSTVVVNLDEVGARTPRYTVREGPLLAGRSHPKLVELCAGAAAGARPLDNRVPSDGFAARYAGYASITVTCRDEDGLAPLHHRRADLPEHVDPDALAAAEELCAELIERLDAGAGLA